MRRGSTAWERRAWRPDRCWRAAGASSRRVQVAGVGRLPQTRKRRSSNSSPTSRRSASRSSTSYQDGSWCTARPELARARQGLGGDPLRAPIDILEQPAVRPLQSEEVVAAVGRGPEHDTIAGRGQGGGGGREVGGGQGRAVGVEEADGIVAGVEQGRRRVEQAVAEARRHGLQQADPLRQDVAEELGAAGGGVGHEARDVGERRCADQVVGDIAQEAGVEAGGLLPG